MKEKLHKISEMGRKALEARTNLEQELDNKLLDLQSKHKTEYSPTIRLTDSSVIFTFKSNANEISVENDFFEGLIEMMGADSYNIIIENRGEIKIVFNY